MKRVALIILGALGILIGIVAVRTALVRSRQIQVAPVARIEVDPQAVARLSRAVQFRTVSHTNEVAGDHAAFVEWLKSAYPRVHAAMTPELVGGHSLLYTWRGSDPSLKPLLLMGHYDVVPVEPAAERRWSVPPFSGLVRDGFIWGRGTLDDKVTVLGILEAADVLLAEGWRPRRTILFAFGHDEERGGQQGAQAIARLLASRGVQLDAVLDEGGAITQGVTPGVAAPVALIGTAEKGFMSVEISAGGSGGHSSMPPPETAIAIVAAAVRRVQDHPLPSRLTSSARGMFAALAPEMNPGTRAVAANLWLTKPVLDLQSKSSNSLRALLHTTTAATMIGGGVKDNVIPVEAHAVINFRILPGDTPASVLAHVRRAVDDPRVKVRVFGEQPHAPSPESDPSAPQFATIARTIRQLHPDTVVAPYQLTGASDSRYFTALTPNIYRFLPVHFRPDDLERFHGIDERVAVAGYLDVIRFYHLLMKNAAG